MNGTPYDFKTVIGGSHPRLPGRKKLSEKRINSMNYEENKSPIAKLIDNFLP